uniref:Pericyclase n=1 Tax=Humicola sp. TaxID=1756120 RepID=A0AA51ZS27_9PEZI|nr:pericyclase [Humicola sp.]
MEKSQLSPELAAFWCRPNDLWGQGGIGVEDFLANFAKNAAEDVKFRVIGQEFEFAGDAVGIEETNALIKRGIVAGLIGSLDTSKPMERQIVRVIGGGPGQWCAVDMTAKGVSKKGKPWFHESVMLLKANEQGKWEEVKVYFDTLHVHNHLVDTK